MEKKSEIEKESDENKIPLTPMAQNISLCALIRFIFSRKNVQSTKQIQ